MLNLRKAFDKDHFWSWSWLLLGLIAIFKGLRLPNRWGATEAIIDYRHGFIKRGLFGETFGRWFDLGQYTHFAVVAFLLFFLLIALVVGLVYRTGVLKSRTGQVAGSVFASCFGLTYLAHIVGYLDLVLALLEVTLISLPNPRARYLAAWPVCIVAVLIHEQFILAFLPLILFQLYLDDRKRVVRLAPLAGVTLLLAAAVSLRTPFDPLQAAGFRHSLAVTADFPLRDDCFVVLERSGLKNVMDTVKDLMGVHGFLKMVGGLVIMLPTATFLCLLTRRRLPAKSKESTAALVVAFSPFLLSVAGWDFPRWDALVCLQAFLVLLILFRDRPELDLEVPESVRNAAILLIGVGMATGKPLMDRAEIDSFPQYHLARDLVGGIRSHKIVPPDK